MANEDELSQLEELLGAELCEIVDESQAKSGIKEVDLFTSNLSSITKDDDSKPSLSNVNTEKVSVIHNGDTDSSDDEERRNYHERKYNDYGTHVKKILDNQDKEVRDKQLDFETRLRQTNIDIKVQRKNSFISKSHIKESKTNILCVPEVKNKVNTDVYTDPVYGIRIVKPLISSTSLMDRMQGREAINMLRVKRFVENEDLSQDWVIGGVIVRKSSSKKSQKGSQFIIWTLSDLKDNLKTVSVFLFRKAYNDLWKTTEGTVVAILNPNVLDRSQNSSDEACLSVDNSERVMILGQSKDLGICKSKKKDGQPCTAFVNLNQCEHCIYHIKQEYNKFSKRQDLQSSTMGKGLVNLQKKVLGKGTVIYGGKAYSALPAANNKIVKQRDENRLMSLSDYYKSEGDKLMINKSPHGSGNLKMNSGVLHSPTTQRTPDIERLNNLNTKSFGSPTNKSTSSPQTSLAQQVANSPKLGKGFGLKGSGFVDLNVSYGEKAAERAKANAIKLIQQNGGIQKVNPNNTKGTDLGKKRALEKLNNSIDENDSKKSKPSDDKKPQSVMSDRFKKILEAKSVHQNLIEQHDDDEKEKYFSKLEKKEAMEEKMLNTFKLACKAVRCSKCKYTAFSAAQKCKDERHPLKVLDTFKRFFKCGNCNNRTVSLDVIPLHACGNCSSSKWEKAGMVREKKVTSLSDGLSIRGEEESFIGAHVSAGKNINLLVPET